MISSMLVIDMSWVPLSELSHGGEGPDRVHVIEGDEAGEMRLGLQERECNTSPDLGAVRVIIADGNWHVGD